ncbi:polysaccharide biosynthesis C-terminal domain-containing protein, partial [Acinetobacter indicus]|uniref:polysaccharide biosynthesis C-terminal domain-containing protein n=1 Tax=Acinetobacter indicus TaxID=756892 RepID=UPI00148BF6F7
FDSIRYFKIIILSIPFFYLSIHLGIYSYLGGSQKYKALVLFIVTIFSLITNFILIDFYGILGAAVSLVLVAIIMSILYHFLNRFVLFNKFFRV